MHLLHSEQSVVWTVSHDALAWSGYTGVFSLPKKLILHGFGLPLHVNRLTQGLQIIHKHICSQISNIKCSFRVGNFALVSGTQFAACISYFVVSLMDMPKCLPLLTELLSQLLFEIKNMMK